MEGKGGPPSAPGVVESGFLQQLLKRQQFQQDQLWRESADASGSCSGQAEEGWGESKNIRGRACHPA